LGKYRLILFIAFFFELGFLTFFRDIAGPYVSPVLLLAFSLIIGICPLYINYNLKVSKETSGKSVPYIYKLIIILTVTTGLSVITGYVLNSIFKSHPIDSNISTIIPTLQIMTHRFLNNEFPYAVIGNLGYLQPSFLPFYWMPFIFSDLLHVDYRWIAFACWISGTIFYTYRLLKKNIQLITMIFLAVIPFAVLFIYIRFVPETIENTVELLIAGFYMILCFSLLSDSLFFRACGIIVTLLSRFANMLWIPLYIGITYFAEKKQRAIILTIAIVLAVILFYVLPFLSQNTLIFQQGQRQITKRTIIEWQKSTDKPAHLFQGVGVACFFYTFKVGDLPRKVKSLQKLNTIISILSILILAIIFLIYQEKYNPKMYYLLSLKVHLAIYFNFLGIPNIYLFIVPVFVSVVILAEIFSTDYKST
jgi:hypothetical protein